MRYSQALAGGLICCVAAGPVLAADNQPAQTAPQHSLPALNCVPEQTGGFHDYPEPGEKYEPALFHSRPFELQENLVFMLNLAGEEGAPDLYLTLTSRTEEGTADMSELECRQVRGADGTTGYSCVNLPPSEMLLINATTYRFTRTAVGGFTFAGATQTVEGDSIFVEYGQCRATAQEAE